MKVTIDRSRWCRGEPDPALLRERDGKMCCLGFFLKACGLRDEEIAGQTEPQHPFECGDPDEIPSTAAFLIVTEEVEDEDLEQVQFDYGTSDDAETLMTVNDDPDMRDAQREERIVSVFAKHGHEVAFVEGVPEKPVAEGPKR